MAEAIVWCHECRDLEGRMKRWRHLCEDCAETQLYTHKQETGHQPYMKVVTEKLINQIVEASLKRGKP
jgi:hypothetical protein